MAIEILPPQLANQIAAGEVVERPASVIKELVENSLDAGATRVDIDIEKGGSKLIRIRDNGAGIAKDQLALALSRHATSKLHSLDDLEAIMSFGFRGEALASISSVSRLTLTSRTAEQSEAWQAYAEGSDMAVKVNPAAHPVGTTIEAVDLFFNTPARRRFLKSDKTEFTHIDEWLKRIAIVKPNIHFTLQHNGKTVRNYRPANTEIQYLQRLGQVSSRNFAENAIKVECEHDDLKLSGYLQSPHQMDVSANYLDVHYFYVNGRLVRDKLVNHAVRQAFANLGHSALPGFVLMLELDPHQVDVNVHPAKHEVRFHQARFVHDFILQALQSALIQVESLAVEPSHDNDEFEQVAQKQEYTHRPLERSSADQPEPLAFSSEQTVGRENARGSVTGQHTTSYLRRESSPAVAEVSEGHSRNSEFRSSEYRGTQRDPLAKTHLPSKQAISAYGELLTTPEFTPDSSVINADIEPMPEILAGKYWVIVEDDTLSLLAIDMVGNKVKTVEINAKLGQGLVGQPLLMPVSVAADDDWQHTLDERDLLLRKLGIELTIRYQQLIIKKVPPYLREAKLATVIPELLQWLRFELPSDAALAAWLLSQSNTGFMSPQQVWQGYCLLDDTDKNHLRDNMCQVPWQASVEMDELDT